MGFLEAYPQEKQNMLYEKFTRGTPANKRIYTGAGLGLRIVRQFIEEIDGEIEVKSTVNLGTTFSCSIPYHMPLADREVEQKEIVAEEPVKEEEREISPLRILLVEDEKLAQMVAGEMLYSKFKVKAVIATTGEQALRLALNTKYDIIFMDIGLPDTTGYEITKQIRNHSKKCNADTPIVALTAHDVKNAAEQAIKVGMSDFLVKPLTAEKTEQVFAKWLTKKTKKITNVKPFISEKIKEKPPIIDDKVINVAAALKMVGKKETLKELLKMLHDMMPEYRQPVEDALAAKDYKALADAAHKLVGESSYCGTLKLKEIAHELKITAKKAKDETKIAVLV